MKKLNRQQQNNRANQLNPNNIQYYKSRVNMSKANSSHGGSSHYMPKKHRQNKEVKLPDGTYRSRLDVNDIYGELKAAINTRHQLDAELDRKWQEVKRGYSRRSEIQDITYRIGNQTHKVDAIIGRLSHHPNQKNAIKLAIDFLKGERNRTDRIIRSWQRTVSEVSRGKCKLINSIGIEHTNIERPKEYIRKKQHRLQELNSRITRLEYLYRR